MDFKYIENNGGKDYYEVILFYNEDADAFVMNIETIFVHCKNNLNTYKVISTSFDDRFPMIAYCMENSCDNSIKEHIKNEIFTIYSSQIEDKMNNEIYDKIKLEEYYNILISDYYKIYNDIKNNIGEELLDKYSKYIVINKIDDINKLIDIKNENIKGYDILIKHYQDVSNFAKNYIRNKKINKIIK